MESERQIIGKKTALQAAALVCVLSAALIGLWLLAEYLNVQQEVAAPENPLTVSLRIEKEGEWTIEYLNVKTYNNTVYKLLIECRKACNFSVEYTTWKGYDAVFINAINGTRNGEEGKWWQYYVNDIYGDIACDRMEVADGDLLEWRFEEPRQ